MNSTKQSNTQAVNTINAAAQENTAMQNQAYSNTPFASFTFTNTVQENAAMQKQATKSAVTHTAQAPVTQLHPAQSAMIWQNNQLDIKQTLDNVVSHASSWYASSTKQLYAVLGQCYELYCIVKRADTEQLAQYKDAINAYCKALDSQQRARELVGKIISIVFNFGDIDRKTRSRYGRVIKRAHALVNPPKNAQAFAVWLEQEGGIVAVLDNASKAESEEESLSAITQYLLSVPSKGAVVVDNDGNEFVVLLARANSKQEVEVVHAFNSTALAEQLARKAYKECTKQKAEQKSAAEIAADAAKSNATQEAA